MGGDGGNVQEDGGDIGKRHFGFLGVFLVLFGRAQLATSSRPCQWDTHVQPDAADGADLLLRQGREDAADDGRVARRRAGVQHRCAAVDLDLDIFALADGRADVDGAVGGLADEDLAVVALGRESDEAWTSVSDGFPAQLVAETHDRMTFLRLLVLLSLAKWHKGKVRSQQQSIAQYCSRSSKSEPRICGTRGHRGLNMAPPHVRLPPSKRQPSG